MKKPHKQFSPPADDERDIVDEPTTRETINRWPRDQFLRSVGLVIESRPNGKPATWRFRRPGNNDLLLDEAAAVKFAEARRQMRGKA